MGPQSSRNETREGITFNQSWGPELSISLWELKITSVQKQSCQWQRRGHPSLGERRKRPLFQSRGPRREGGGQADLQSEEQSKEMIPKKLTPPSSTNHSTTLYYARVATSTHDFDCSTLESILCGIYMAGGPTGQRGGSGLTESSASARMYRRDLALFK